ncbi:hypothetical protein Asera_45220 [Actinocatenispora sera]|uniref:Uncharacterized protein n=1 Tax=Actinocatenispora sera TaxID=390989 RepID=A0A810L4K6_9ACTN|nr:hypothetical protein Asera_45220 [Actinocatenispora sera]
MLTARTLFEVRVEHLPPRLGMHHGGAGEHTVKIEQAGADAVRKPQHGTDSNGEQGDWNVVARRAVRRGLPVI